MYFKFAACSRVSDFFYFTWPAMESEGEAIPVTQKEENNLSAAEAYSYVFDKGWKRV